MQQGIESVRGRWRLDLAWIRVLDRIVCLRHVHIAFSGAPELQTKHGARMQFQSAIAGDARLPSRNSPLLLTGATSMLLQLALVALANAALLASWIVSKHALACWELAALAMIFGILAIRIDVRSHGRRISPGSIFVVFAALTFVAPIWGRHADASAASGDGHRQSHAHAIWRLGRPH